MLRAVRFLFALALSATAIMGANVRRAVVSTTADESSCSAPSPVAKIDATKPQVFLWFVAERVRPADQLRVEWLNPSGQVADSADYSEIPAAAALCFTTQLQIAGYAAASSPGQWRVQVLVNGLITITRDFQIVGKPASGLQVAHVTMTPGASGFDLQIEGSGFSPISTVHLARFTSAGGWTYLSSVQPSPANPTELVSHHDALPPGEYWVIVQNPDRSVSPPMPFVIATGGGYKLPIPAGEQWVLTQGPNGSFSHWGNSAYAYDIAPLRGRCVVAMRAGIVHTHDFGMYQDHSRRTYGNYITIDHGDGEYSHYAHLATGTFVVRDGERVEQGQALATVGNSGYTLGEGGGYHVHVQVTRSPSISSGSVPFRFDDLDGNVRTGVIVSANRSTLDDCSRPAEGPVMELTSLPSAAVATKSPAAPAAVATKVPSAPTTSRPQPTHEPQFRGSVSVAQWWSDFVLVRKGAKLLDATLAWADSSAEADLHLMSPSGEHYGWYGNTTGYSGQQTRPQEFRIPHPKPGIWRISVEGTRGGPGPVDFSVDTNAPKYSVTGRGGSGE
jgi:murein DD-endopeptidase MepM/ murein hydrolase activator NlpD